MKRMRQVLARWRGRLCFVMLLPLPGDAGRVYNIYHSGEGLRRRIWNRWQWSRRVFPRYFGGTVITHAADFEGEIHPSNS